MSHIFSKCSSLSSLYDLSKSNTINVTYIISILSINVSLSLSCLLYISENQILSE